MKSNRISFYILGLTAVFLIFIRLPTPLFNNSVNSQSLKTLLPVQDKNATAVNSPIVCSPGVLEQRIQARMALVDNLRAHDVDMLWQCLSTEDDSQFTLLDLGVFYWNEDKHNLALNVWSQLVVQDPLAFHFLIGAVDAGDPFYTLPDTVEVWQTLIKVGTLAVQSAPERSELYLLMREVYSEKLHDPKSGQAWLRKGLLYMGDNWPMYWLLYGDSVTLGDYKQAQAYLEKAWELDETHQYKRIEDYYGRYGSIFLRQGDNEQAITWLERCLAITPQNNACLIELGEAFYLTQTYEKSLSVFGRVDIPLLQIDRQEFVLGRIEELENLLNTQP